MSGAGEGLLSGFAIAFDPLLPLWLLAGLAVIAAVTVLLGFVARAPGSWLRSAVAALILLALANPAAVQEEREPLKDVAVIVIDESPSQRFGERAAATQAAAAEIEAALAAFGDTLETRVLRVAHDSVDDAADGTRLLAPLREVLADTPARRIAGAILLTDGQLHDLPARAEGTPEGEETDPLMANGGPIQAPIHTIVTGAREEKDRRLVVLESPGFGLVGEESVLRLRVEDATAEGEQTRVTVRVNGEFLRPARVQIGADAAVSIPIRRRGPTIVELETPVADGELTPLNNRAVLSINGVRDRLRVLLVSGEPHPGERTWRNLLKSDPSVDLVHFTILRPPEKQDGTPIHELSLIAFPTRQLFEVKLQDFDLVVFDRFRRRGVLPSLYLSNIVDYIDQGGAFLEAVGPSFAGPYSLFRTPLGRVLPGEPTGAVITRGYRPDVTDIGKRHPVTAGLPGGPLGEAGEPRWGRWFRQIEVEPLSGQVLMEGVDESPLLILDRINEGRVAQFMSDHIWLWARGVEGGGPQRELLRRLAHWLMKEPDLEEEDLRAEVQDGVLQVTRRTVAEQAAPVEVTDPLGETVELSLERDRRGAFSARLPVTEAGVYRLTDGEMDAIVAAGALNPVEFAAVTASDAAPQRLAEASGGGVFWLADGSPAIRRTQPDRVAAGSNWIGLRANNDYVVTGLSTTSLAPPILVLIALLGVLAAVWRREAD